MKYLVIYDSKKGCTEDCAKYIGSKLNTTDIVNLKLNSNVNLDNYDCVIIGSPIYVGNPTKNVKMFIEKNRDLLLSKNVNFFLCGANSEKDAVELSIKTSIPESLRQHVKNVCFCGGEFRLDKMNFFERFIIKMISKQNEKQGKTMDVKINYNEIDNFIDNIKK